MTDPDQSITSRRSFVASLAASVLGLAGLWHGLGLIGGGHSHGHGGSSVSREEFERRVREYVDAHRTTDGGVQPPRAPPDHTHGSGSDGHSHAVPVYLLARRWHYTPSRYRLRVDWPYEFRMMSVDVTHGAAIGFDSGSRIFRLPPGQLVTAQIRFEEPGQYPVYCSYYCGQGHNRMSGTLVVE